MTKPSPKPRITRVGELIAERYRVERVIVSEPPRRRVQAVETSTDRRVEIVELPMAAAVPWTAAMTISHPALPALVATLSRQGASFGVFEHVEGNSLNELGGRGTRFDPTSAVRAALWLVEAVSRLGRAGIVHGAIDGEAIVFRSREPESILLTYRGALPADSPYRPPERGLDDPNEPGDDLWGLSGALFQLLTARPPPRGVYSEEEVQSAGIEDELLCAIVAQGLAANPSRRSRRLASLRHPLAQWLARRAARAEQSIAPPSANRPRQRPLAGLRALGMSHVSDDPMAPAIEVRSTPLSEPPPDELEMVEVADPAPIEAHAPRADERLSDGPTSIGAIATNSRPTTSAPPPRSNPRPSVLARPSVWLGVSLGAGLVIAVFLVLDRSSDAARAASNPPAPPPSAPEPPSAPARAAPPLPTPVASSSAKPAAVAHRIAAESTGACVVRHMPVGSFRSTPNMEFLCSTPDPRAGDHLFRAALATSSDAKKSPGLRMWSELTWYAMAGYAALRVACCPDAPEIELPEPDPSCSPLGPVLDDLGRAAASGADTERSLSRFAAAVDCELGHRRGPVYWRKERPGGAEATTLRGLLESVENPRPPE